MRFNTKQRKDNTLTDLNHTYGDTQLIHDQKISRAAKDQYYRSKEYSGEYLENSEEETDYPSHSKHDLDSYATHSNKLRKIKSKNNLKTNFDMCQKFKATDYTDGNTYSTLQSFREYQPSQKVSQQFKKRRHPIEEVERYQQSPMEVENYPTFNNNDESLYNLSDSEFPSKIVEKQLRTKSVENQRRNKRSRMANYLYQVPKNNSYKRDETSPYQRKEDQYRTHQMIAVSDQMDNEYPANDYHSYNHTKRQKEYSRFDNRREEDNYLSSLNIPQSMKPKENIKRCNKSSSRSKLHHKQKNVSEISYQENVHENVLRNMQRTNEVEHSSRTHQKHNELVRALKEREKQHKNNSQRD